MICKMAIQPGVSDKNVCPCCLSNVVDDSGVKHDELCSYNNTRNAVLEFPPEDFILGVQNPQARKMVNRCKRILYPDRWKVLEEIAYRMTSEDRSEREQAYQALMDSRLIKVSSSETLMLIAVVKTQHPRLFARLRNFFFYKAASHVRYQELRDEFYRWRARKDAMDHLFAISFATDVNPK